MKIIGLDHVGIQVADLEESIREYREYLEMGLMRREEYPEAGMRLAYMGGKGMTLELLQQTDGRSETGLKHICLLCEGIDELFHRIKGAGLRLLHKSVQEMGDSRLFFARFPSGEWIEFLERKKV
jgi:catechol 2,3-dioxygenase-like lactoylglutathione lyase family enzyme